MEPALLGVVFDSSIIIGAERKSQTVEEFLTQIEPGLGEIENVISAVTVAELVHGIERANSAESGNDAARSLMSSKSTFPSTL